MSRLVRIAALILLAVLAAFLALAALTALFIHPEAYRERLEAAVVQATGKTPELQSEISLSLFPRPHLATGPLELRDLEGYGVAPFLRAEKIQADIDILSLLQGKAALTELRLTDLSLKLAVNQKGEPNWRNTSIVPAPAPAMTENPEAGGTGTPEEISIGSLRLENARVTYHDFGSGTLVTFILTEASLSSLRPGERSLLTVRGDIRAQTETAPVSFSLDAAGALPRLWGQELPFTLSGTLDTGSITGEGGFIPPSADGTRFPGLRGSIHLTSLDLNRHLAPALATKGGDSGSRRPRVLSRQEQRELDAASKATAAALARMATAVALDLRLTVDSLILPVPPVPSVPSRLEGLPVGGLRGDIRSGRDSFEARLSADSVAQGSAAAAFSMSAKDGTLTSTSTGSLKNLRLEEVLSALTGSAPASGLLSLDWNLSGQGADWHLLAPSLTGTAKVELSGGRIPAVTPFPAGAVLDSLSASWTVGKGEAVSDDLRLSGGAGTATGSGRIALPDLRLEYRLALLSNL